MARTQNGYKPLSLSQPFYSCFSSTACQQRPTFPQLLHVRVLWTCTTACMCSVCVYILYACMGTSRRIKFGLVGRHMRQLAFLYTQTLPPTRMRMPARRSAHRQRHTHTHTHANGPARACFSQLQCRRVFLAFRVEGSGNWCMEPVGTVHVATTSE